MPLIRTEKEEEEERHSLIQEIQIVGNFILHKVARIVTHSIVSKDFDISIFKSIPRGVLESFSREWEIS